MGIQSGIPTSALEQMKKYNFKTSDNNVNKVSGFTRRPDIEEVPVKEESKFENIFNDFANDFGDSVEIAWDNIQESGAYVTGKVLTWTDIISEEEFEEEFNNINADARSTDSVSTSITDAITSFGDSVENISDEFVTSTKDLLAGKISIFEYKERLEATKRTGQLGIAEGVIKFGEGVVDANVSVNKYVKATLFDTLGIISTDEKNALLDKTKANIAEDNTKYIFDWFYEDTKAGQNIHEKSFAADSVRSVYNTVGEVGLNIGLAYAGGTTLMATSAGTSAMGKGTETAFANGATYEQGLVSGAITGVYTGASYAIGGAINKLEPFSSEVKNAVLRVGLDSLLGAADPSINSEIEAIYAKGYYDTNGNYVEFDDSMSLLDKAGLIYESKGGVGTSAKSAAFAGTLSGVSEAAGLSKSLRNKESVDLDNISTKSATNSLSAEELATKKARYNELSEIANTAEYKQYMDYAEKGYAQQLRADYDSVARELATLKSELGIGDVAEELITKEVKNNSDNKSNLQEKYVSPINHNIDNLTNEIDTKNMSIDEMTKKYNELMTIKNSDEYKQYLKNAEEGNAQVLRKEYYQIDNSLDELEESIINYYKNDDLVALMTRADVSDYEKEWNMEDIRTRLHNAFDGRYDSSYIDNIVDNEIKVIKEEDWADVYYSNTEGRIPADACGGFVHPITGVVYVKETANTGAHSPMHESLHKLSEWKQELSLKPDGNVARKTGIREYYDAIRSDGKWVTSDMANENLTEYLSSKVDDGKYYVTGYDSKNHTNKIWWERIDNTMESVYGSDSILLDAYLDNNTDFLRSYFNYYGGEGTYDYFVTNMSVWYDENTEAIMEQIVSTIESNTYPKQNNGILSIIEKIFGG